MEQIKETMFSGLNRYNYTHGLTEIVATCSGPAQVQVRGGLRAKKMKQKQAAISNSEAVSN